MGIKGFTRLLLLASALTASSGWAAEIHGRSSTQLLWFNNYFNNKRQVELGEYLRLSVTNLDKEGKASLFGYGRVTQDLNNGDGFNSRLYYLYGEYRGLWDKVDFRLGRQFINQSAGSAIVDGGQIDLRNVGPVGLSVYGGRNVIFGLDHEAGHGGDLAFGAAAYLQGFKDTDLELSWFRKWDRWDIARDTLGASFKQYLFNNVRLYGNTRYDLVSETFSEVLAGVKYYPLSNLIFTGEWYQSYPVFDTTSIYSVFAVDRYQEAVFRADYTINDRITVNGGYTSQWFEEGGRGHIYQLGCSVRPLEPLQLNVEYDNNQGYNGKTNGVLVDAYYDLTRALQLAGGFGYDVYKRDVMNNKEIARTYWLGGKYRLSKRMLTSLRVENNVNAQYESDTQGRFVFDYDF
ncbi:hypothetical protein [Geobacter sp.]|uniref:hypothetical protein n=1 Tax=Geobacter sp. TaxID=46610 RepID=UPI002630EF3D|nr:hypothetical protein [Geobacter sp.]